MAKFSFNSDNLNNDNSIIIEGIKIDQTIAEQLEDFPLSLISSQGDFNGDSSNDIFVQSSLLFVDDSLTQESFVVLGSNSLPSTINLAELDGSNGFAFSDLVSLGNNFSDLNGDDLDDLSLTVINPVTQETSMAVILGNNEFPATIDISTLDGSDGFRIFDDSNNLVGAAVTGDINNDNLNDLLFTSTDLENPEIIVNKVVFGLDNYPADFDVSTLDGSNGFTVSDTKIISGSPLDINGDDFEDLIFVDNNNPIAHILFGDSQFSAEVDLDTLTSEQGFSIIEEGGNTSDRFFGGLIEDFNGDGIADIVIQKSIASESTEEGQEDNLEPNQVSIIYGSSENTATTFDLASIDGSNGFTIASTVEIQSILDINGDNLEDLFVKDTAEDSRSYVIFGSDSVPNNFDLNTLDGSNGVTFANTNLNPATIANVGAIGDVNGDDIDDLAIDTEGDNTYILLGSQEAFPATLDLTDTNTNAIEISGDRTGGGITAFSDINGDGADEIIFNSVVNEEDNSTATGAIVFGDSDLSFATNNSTENPEESPEEEPENPQTQTIELFRFRNTTLESGTYVFVGAEERDAIRENPDFNQTFALDGEQDDGTINPAFEASLEPGEDLIPFYRLASLDLPGTFLFVSTGEYDAIFADDSDQSDKWEKEGLNEEGEDIAEFYLLDGSADRGVEFNRFQNTQNNTFLYAGPEETEAIASDSNLSSLFTNQGVAFESLS